jgi:UDP-2,3-diacylglucosamine pyrophosphatase LpxH
MGRYDKTRYRAIWISDVHLGSKACRIEPLLEFISSIECETLYLVGDIIDLWSLKRKWHWPQSHNDFVRKVLKRASRGAQVVLTGHIHRPEIKQVGDILYCNDGDWVENCTALVEHLDGRLELLHVERELTTVRATEETLPEAAETAAV